MFKKKQEIKLTEQDYEMLDSFMLIGRHICQASPRIEEFLKPVLKELYEDHYEAVNQPAPKGDVMKVNEDVVSGSGNNILSRMTDGRI